MRDRLDEYLAELSGRPRRISSRSTPEAEDVHHFVEQKLIGHIGELALKLHSGRSRNEQIATDLRLYMREAGSDSSAICAMG